MSVFYWGEERMTGQQRWARIRKQAPSWGLSLAAHAVVLMFLGMITWVATGTQESERLVLLVDKDTVSATPPSTKTGLGSADGTSSAQVPSRQTNATRLTPSVFPQPLALRASAEPLPQTSVTLDRLVGDDHATRSIVQTLCDASASVDQPVGTGRSLTAGQGFGTMIDSMRRTGLDVVLVLDATDSMSPYIEQSKRRLRQVVTVVTHLVPDSRFGVVAYKDYGDDYGPKAVRVLEITSDRETVCTFIEQIVAGGGADEPEPIHEALAVVANARQMGWRRRRTGVVILVGDSSIHRSGRERAYRYARQLATELHKTINVIDVGGAGERTSQRTTVHPDLARIAEAGGGSAFLLKDRDAFWRHLIVSVFGRQYEQDVDTIIRKFVAEEQ